jgi:anti-sigma B factor antagonist
MNLPTEIFGDVIVVHTPEELGNDQADNFERLLDSLDRVRVVLDFDATETIDSRGLTSLLNSQDRLRELDGDLKLATTNLCNRKILEMTRLDQHLEVYESVVDAVKSFR